MISQRFWNRVPGRTICLEYRRATIIRKPPQRYPGQFVTRSEPRLWIPLHQSSKLLANSQIFQEQLAARTKELASQNEQKPQQAQPETDSTWSKPGRVHLSSA